MHRGPALRLEVHYGAGGLYRAHHDAFQPHLFLPAARYGGWEVGWADL